MIHFTTRSGAEYAVDPIKKTWARLGGPRPLLDLPTAGNYVEMSEIRVGWGVTWSIDDEVPGQIVHNNCTTVTRIWQTDD